MKQCPVETLQLHDEGAFLTHGHINVTAHRIGLALCGVATLATWIVAIAAIIMHLFNFWMPDEQRQIVRILFLPMIYSLCSMLGYFLWSYFEYFELIQALSEALAIASFMMLLFAYVSRVDGGHRHEIIAKRGKFEMPFPLCCISYWPYKPGFLNVLKWCTLQYGIVRVLGTIAGAVTEAFHLFCANSNSPSFANIWIAAADFLSMSIAIYSLLLWYTLCKPILKGGRRRPAVKFLTIKLTVGILFGQTFIIKLLAGADKLPTSPYWSQAAVGHSLTGLLTCIEMVVFAFWYMHAFSWKDYRESKPYPTARTPFWRSLGHCLNITDILIEVWLAISFFCAYCCNKHGTHSSHFKSGLDAGAAFNSEGAPEKESWVMVDRPPKNDPEMEGQDGEDEEEPEYHSFRHTLGANTPEVNHIVETLSDSAYTPKGQRIKPQDSAVLARKSMSNV